MLDAASWVMRVGVGVGVGVRVFVVRWRISFHCSWRICCWRVGVGVRVRVLRVAVAAVVVETAQVATPYLVRAVAQAVADPTLRAAVAVARAVGYSAGATRRCRSRRVRVRVRVFVVCWKICFHCSWRICCWRVGVRVRALEAARVAICRAIFRQSIICLLYTSPSPRDGLLSRMPSSA